MQRLSTRKRLLSAVSVLALLIGSSACGVVPTPIRNTSPRGEASYIDNAELEMEGPPPPARLTGDRQDLKVIALDWKSLGGEAFVPTSSVSWTRVTAPGGPLKIDIDTAQLPIRVVVYVYRAVNARGVPDETAGQENRCENGKTSWCTYDSTGRTVVTMPEQPSGSYLVVQAAWITDSGSDVQVSYAGQIQAAR